MQPTTPRKPRGAKWWALVTLTLLLSLFGIAANSVWRDNSTIGLLGNVALLAMLFLLRSLVVLDRRATGARGEWQRDYSEVATLLVRLGKIVGIGLVLLGFFLVTSVSLSWATRIFGLAVVGIGVLLVSNSFDRFMRIVGIALVPLDVFLLGCLYLDAAHGYRVAWPLYTFVAAGLASVLVWPYLLAKAYAKWLSK